MNNLRKTWEIFKTNLERLSNILRSLENCSAKQFFNGSIVLRDVGWRTFCVVFRRQRSQHLLSRCMTAPSLSMRYAAVVILCMFMIVSAAFTAASRLMHKVSRGHGNLENHGILVRPFSRRGMSWKSYGKWWQYTGCMVPRRRRWSLFYPTTSLHVNVNVNLYSASSQEAPLMCSMCRVLIKKTRLQCTTKTVSLHVRLTQIVLEQVPCRWSSDSEGATVVRIELKPWPYCYTMRPRHMC